MYKKLDNGVEINYPVNDGTAFRIEGFTGYFTIIDAIVVPKNHSTYVLLEHNKLGEDLTLVVEMPQTELLKLSLFDNEPMNVGLGTNLMPQELLCERSLLPCLNMWVEGGHQRFHRPDCRRKVCHHHLTKPKSRRSRSG